LELWLLTLGRKQFGVMWSPLVLLGCGMISGIGFLVFFYDKKITLQEFNWDWKKRALMFLVSFFGIWKCGDMLRTIIRNEPIDFYNPTASDVIPQIGILVDRFLSGEFPYRMITEWSLQHELYPTYLPLTWMPFVIPDVIGFDYRWMAFAVLILGIWFYSYKLISWNTNWFVKIFLLVIPFLYLYCFLEDDNTGTFRFTVESMIGGYYLFLATAILSKSNWLRGLALLLCLLSRYALVLWIPLFFFVLLFKEKRSNIYKIIGWISLGVIVFYVIPFLSKDPTIFFKGFEYHTEAALMTFNRYHYQSEHELPALLDQGLGLAIYFNEMIEGTSTDKSNALRLAHLISLCLMVLLSMIGFYKIKDRIDYRIFLLGTLKIYLVLFYNFIQIPFNYLYLPLVFVSLTMFALLFSRKNYAIE